MKSLMLLPVLVLLAGCSILKPKRPEPAPQVPPSITVYVRTGDVTQNSGPTPAYYPRAK